VVFGLLHAHRHAVVSLLCGYVCLRDTGVSDYVGRGVHFCAGMTMTHSAFGTPRVAGRSRLPVAASVERRVAPVIGNPEYRCAAVLPNPRREAKAVAEDLRQVGLQTVGQVDNAPDAI